MSGPEQEGTGAGAAPPAGTALAGPAEGAASAFSLRGEPPRVMRLSRKTLAAIGVVAGLGIGGSLIYALQRPVHVAPQNLYDTQSRNKADSVTAAPKDYSQVPKLGQPLPGDLGKPILSAENNGQFVPVPPVNAPGNGPADPQTTAAAQARQRIGQERDSARTSRLFLGGGNTAEEQPQERAGGIAGPATSATATQAASAPTGKRGFMTVGANRTTVSDERVSAPASPNILQAGSIIPAALITGIQSDLPGQITAQVIQNVYDSPTGRILLIPQGSRLIGEYDSEVSAGQNRVLLAWDRLILPGGRSILLDRPPGTDAAGMAGLHDRTNYHWGNMLKAAFLSTLMGVGTQLATDSDDELVKALRYGTQDTVNQTGRQIVQRQINVPPTLTVRPGHVLRVLVTRDMIVESAPPGGRP